MTPERIAEIAAEIHVFGKQCGDRWLSATELAELCRLARLGLRVEQAKNYEVTEDDADGRTYPFAVVALEYVRGPNADAATVALVGKRVALVGLEDSK